mmetsp:Transcript_41715/g.117919  ORF Transcript_41715/g.117919 Transcript_41715/m.117919 type:complete len:377 (+) Transcript_41715:284-1414(+)
MGLHITRTHQALSVLSRGYSSKTFACAHPSMVRGLGSSWALMNRARISVSDRLKQITTQRPPQASRSKAPSSTRSNCSASWFSHIRTAWDVNFEGCSPRSSSWPPRKALITAANLPALPNGPCSLCQRKRHSEIRAAIRGSLPHPHSRTIHAISRGSSSASHSDAGFPSCWFMRRSSGPTERKPRCAWSSWGDDTPRSMTTPESSSSGGIAAARSPKGRCRMRNRPSICSRLLPTATAVGSTSKAKRRPSGESRASMAAEWPPRPKVQSTKTPPPATSSGGITAATVGLQMTGTCPAVGPQISWTGSGGAWTSAAAAAAAAHLPFPLPLPFSDSRHRSVRSSLRRLDFSASSSWLPPSSRGSKLSSASLALLAAIA